MGMITYIYIYEPTSRVCGWGTQLVQDYVMSLAWLLLQDYVILRTIRTCWTQSKLGSKRLSQSAISSQSKLGETPPDGHQDSHLAIEAVFV